MSKGNVKYVRTRTVRNPGKVHKSEDGENPLCDSTTGENREYELVDVEVYPRSWWKKCQKKECFGGDTDADCAAAKSEEGSA